MELRSVTVQNFTSFADQAQVSPLGAVSAVVGRNNAGKSNLFRAVMFLMRYGATGNLNAPEQFANLWHNGEQDEDVEISVEVALTQDDWDSVTRVNKRPEPPFPGSVTFGATFSPAPNGIRVRQTGYLEAKEDAVQPNLHQAVRRRILHVPSLRRIEPEATTASPASLSEPQDGRGLKAWLNQLLAARSISEQKAASAFRHDLSRVAGFDDVRLDVVAGTDGNLEVLVSQGAGTYRTRLEECGAGLQTVVTVLAALHRAPGGVVLLDDPGSNLHPTAQSTFAHVAASRARASGGQVVFATHAPTVLEAVPYEATFEVVRRGATSEIKRPSVAGTQLWEILYDLGHRPHHLQLANVVLFVEGPTDEQAFRAWWRTLFHEDPEPFVAVLTLGGNNMVHLHPDAIEALGRPVFAFVDSDRTGEGQPPNDQALAFVDRVGEVAHVHVSARRSIENYLSSDSLGTAVGRDGAVDLGEYGTPEDAGIEFSKRAHVGRAAARMTADEIPDEIADFLEAVRARSQAPVG